MLIITSERSSNFQTTEGDKQLQTSGHLVGESKWGMWCDGVPLQFEAKNSFTRHCARIPRITIETKKWKWYIEAEGHFVCVFASRARSAPFWYFQRASAGFQQGDRHLFVIFFGEGWKSMTSLPPFLTLRILLVFAGSSYEDILSIKVRTKREKSPKTWSLMFD